MKLNLRFWRKPKPPETTISKPYLVEGDWSLRPSAATYVDRAQETHKVLARIEKSTASVVGIAGVRGSGKSSLALKVLEENREKGAFTLLIHSPTGYEPHEFLLSIFQRICERAIFLLDSRFGNDGSLKAQGLKELRRLRSYIKISFLGGLLISLVFTWFYLRQLEQSKIEGINSYFGARIQEIQKQELDLKEGIARLEPPTSEDSAQLLATRRGNLKTLQKEERDLREKQYEMISRNRTKMGDLILTGIPTILFYIGLAIAALSYRKIKRRIDLVRKYPSEVGLRQLALDLLEHLSYQRTLSASAEASVGIGKSLSKFTRGKTLQARPVSLPGLTAECSRFLELTASVFGGRSVVVLDELDKIKEPDELEKLLRGVKGILTSHRVHFLLTVSEDALARFSTRQRTSRDILESTFEEIVVLDRVNLTLAEHIVLTVSDYDATLQLPQSTSATLFWIFGSGIPREIKRYALLCRDAGLDPVRSRALEVWRILYAELIENISSWAALVGGEDRYSYYFLSTLDKLRNSIPAETFHVQQASDWVSDLLKISLHWKRLIATILTDEHSDKKADQEELSAQARAIAYPFRRAMLEIILAGSSCLWTIGNNGAASNLPRQAEAELLALFNYFSANLEFAEEKALIYLGILESVGLIQPSWKEAA